MEKWIDHIGNLLLDVFGRATAQETYIMAGLSVLSGALVLWKISEAFGARRGNVATALLMTAGGVIILAGAWSLAPLFSWDENWMPLAAALAALLILVIPLSDLLFRGGYLSMLAAWMLALLVIGVVLRLEPAVKRTSQQMLEKTGQLQEHRRATEEYR